MSAASLTDPLRWFAPVPQRRYDLVRMVTFGYAAGWLLLRFPYIHDVARLPSARFEPVGVLAPLDSPPARGFVLLVWGVATSACVLATIGRFVRAAAPLGAAGVLLIATLTSSFGQVFHTEHLLVIHVGVLGVAAIVERPSSEPSGWPLNLMMAAVVVTYVEAGIAKLRWSGAGWVSGDVLRNWVAVDNLRKWQVDDLYSPIGGWMAGVGWVWFPIALITLIVELGAPIALLPNRLRYGWIAAAWGFHVGIFALMAITFPYQLVGVAYAAFLPLEAWERAALEHRPTQLTFMSR
jgi:hypothetical protein